MSMSAEINRDAVYAPSDDVVAREIEGELIIIPISAGVGDVENALFTLNETGRDIWIRLDGRQTLGTIAAQLANEYAATVDEVEADVLGLVQELAIRRMVVKK